MRQFFMADYDQDTARLRADVTPGSRLAFQFVADAYQIDYDGPDCGGPGDQVATDVGVTFDSQCHGRAQVEGVSYTADVQWTATRAVTGFAFFTSASYESDQIGRSYGATGLAANAAQAADPTRDWFATLEYTDDTYGLGLNFHPKDSKFDAGLQYVISDAEGSTGLSVASGSPLAAPGRVPDTEAKLDTLQAFGRWRFGPQFALRLNYWWEQLDTRDWAFDGATPTSSNNVVLAGQQSWDYDAQIFAAAFVYSR
jgi:hypothetical protein